MTQAIAGVSPPTSSERTVMVVWPSISSYSLGRLLGRGYAIKKPFSNNKVLWPGNLIVLATIPIALILFFARLAPFTAVRYRLTNRRVIIEKGMKFQEAKSVELDRFDTVTVEVQDGQQWFNAGDLVLRQGDTVMLRLEGVSRPESFRQILLKSHLAYVGVKNALAV